MLFRSNSDAVNECLKLFEAAEDALEFILAGATAVSIGTANFTNPYATVETVRGIEDYMKKNKIQDIQSLIGVVE